MSERPKECGTPTAGGGAMMQEAHDAQLIGRIAVQDQAALRGLYARHQTRVFRFLLRLVRQEAIAEELTNKVGLAQRRQLRGQGQRHDLGPINCASSCRQRLAPAQGGELE
jgi:hypothetical protein